MKDIKGFQRNFLRKEAHGLKPVIMLGKNGFSGELQGAMDKALEDHELIKVKFLDFKEKKQTLAREAAEKTGSVLVSIIGNIAIFYRQSNDPEKRVIKIPSKS